MVGYDKRAVFFSSFIQGFQIAVRGVCRTKNGTSITRVIDVTMADFRIGPFECNEGNKSTRLVVIIGNVDKVVPLSVGERFGMVGYGKQVQEAFIPSEFMRFFRTPNGIAEDRVGVGIPPKEAFGRSRRTDPDRVASSLLPMGCDSNIMEAFSGIINIGYGNDGSATSLESVRGWATIPGAPIKGDGACEVRQNIVLKRQASGREVIAAMKLRISLIQRKTSGRYLSDSAKEFDFKLKGFISTYNGWRYDEEI